MSYQDILGIVATEIVGDFGLKHFANEGGVNNFMVGIIGYVGVIYYLIRSLQGSTILLVNGAWDGLSTVIESIIALIFEKERFTDPMQYVGLVLIIIGLTFMKIPMKRKNKFIFPAFTNKII